MLTDIKGETDSNKMIVLDFNTPLTSMDRSSRQRIDKNTQTLNNTLDQIDLIDIYETVHPKAVEYTFFSSTQRTFSRIGRILGHKSSLCKLNNSKVQ